ncbi:organic solute transporter subunit alpha [Mytilus galloprovincialis]|uniref:Organic solute transporter subunit alpha n=1 Tax=Mytilus galloprovincialis TaxID=29158 RepID=A0A8B6BUG4_MYTGA|nr:organic solute transporter subunit alpha [Mytilus galloprovincialis]
MALIHAETTIYFGSLRLTLLWDFSTEKPKDTNEFSAVDAVSLFNTKIDIALDKQRSSIVSELQEKLQVNTDIKGEGIKIQFSFNQERLSNLDRFKNYLSRGSVEEVFELIDSEKKALTHRNKLLRIADRHGWGTVKEYSDNDLTDNSEDASKLRAAIFRASKKRQTPYARNQPTQPSYQRTRPGVFDGMSNNQLFLGSQNYGQRQIFNPRPQFQNYRQNFTPGANLTCHYCNLPGHFAKFCPYTAQLQRRQPAAATVTNPEPFNKQQ